MNHDGYGHCVGLRYHPSLQFHMEQASDNRISPETLQRLRVLYRAVAARRDFAALSAFERWLLLRTQATEMPPPISGPELAALDTLDVTLKLQLLDWMAGGRDTPRAR
jgi:hypothetical protein